MRPPPIFALPEWTRPPSSELFQPSKNPHFAGCLSTTATASFAVHRAPRRRTPPAGREWSPGTPLRIGPGPPVQPDKPAFLGSNGHKSGHSQCSSHPPDFRLHGTPKLGGAGYRCSPQVSFRLTDRSPSDRCETSPAGPPTQPRRQRSHCPLFPFQVARLNDGPSRS